VIRQFFVWFVDFSNTRGQSHQKNEKRFCSNFFE
jgi:hypothetical protein